MEVLIGLGIGVAIAIVPIGYDLWHFERYGCFWSDRFDPKWRWAFEAKRKRK